MIGSQGGYKSGPPANVNRLFECPQLFPRRSLGEGSTDFESDLGGWVVTGPPPGSAPQGNNFIRMTGSGFPEGAVITTRDTLYFGFGFEGISDAQTRKEVMQRAMRYLLR